MPPVGARRIGERSGTQQPWDRPQHFLGGVVFENGIWIPEGGALGKSLISTADGHARWGYVPIEVLSLVGATADATGTLIDAAAANLGKYLVTAYLEVTTAGAAGKTLAMTLGFTDHVGAVTPTIIAAFPADAQGRSSGILTALLGSAAAGLDYAITIGGAGAQPTYRAEVEVIRLT